MNKATFIVGNIHCASCVGAIERAMKAHEGVVSITVSLVDSKATIVWNEELYSTANILQFLQDAGYPATVAKKNVLVQIKEQDKLVEQKLHRLSKTVFYYTLCTIPLVIISMGAMLLQYEALQTFTSIALLTSIQILLTLPVIAFSYERYTSGVLALIRKQPNMDSLVALGTGTAFCYSLVMAVCALSGDVMAYHNLYFESVNVILTLVVLGEYLETKAKYTASKSLYALASLAPATATKQCDDGTTKIVAIKALHVGDTIIVQHGMNIPVDGIIATGTCSIQESMLTGESMPVVKTVGDSVFAGTTIIESMCSITVTATNENTYLQTLVHMVQEAQSSKAPIARLADKVSIYFVPIVIGIACIASIIWFFATYDSALAMHILITSLIIACPCAMGLATPLSLVVGMSKATQFGIIIKNAVALETTAKIDTVFLDKTGTITNGSPMVSSSTIINSVYTERQVQEYIVSIAPYSKHPITEALAQWANGVETPYSVSDFSYTIGKGTRAVLHTQGSSLAGELYVGSQRFIDEYNVQYSKNIAEECTQTITSTGASPLYVAYNKELIAIIAIQDTIREGVPSVINALQKSGINVVMLSGDKTSTAEAIARTVGITDVHAELLPEEKASIITSYNTQKKHTMMVGDGVNDAIALSSADIGVAMGAGVDIAQESSSVVLMNNRLAGVYTTIMLSKATITNIKENLFWAFIYNIVSIPIATGILYAFGGPLLSPMIAGFAMVFSSVSVVGNSLRLQRFKEPIIEK